MTTENQEKDQASDLPADGPVLAQGVDDEPVEANRRLFGGWLSQAMAVLGIAYVVFHLYTLNIAPLETWSFRIIHVCGALILGFLLFAGARFTDSEKRSSPRTWTTIAAWILLVPAVYALVQTVLMYQMVLDGAMRIPPDIETWHFGWPLVAATGLGIVVSWFHQRARSAFSMPDLVLIVCSIAAAAYFLVAYNTSMRMSTGTSFAPVGISFAAVVGVAVIMELTRRLTGLALVVISLIFLIYVFAGPYLPGFLGYPGLSAQRFFSQVYTDAGVLGPTTAVSSTYIILFIIFAAFLQASKVGDYFVNFAFAVAGHSRGGPAKVSIFASGLMGMINGTSAGNVVATGSLTIPLMKKVGYSKKSAGAVEAAASTGGQIMPPIMGAGAFIMAEITGIPYTEIAIAAIIPAILYFASVYFMVDFEAARTGMRGMRRDELPSFRRLIKQVYLLAPIIILIVALFMGYSVIRAGTLATVSAVVVSWLSPNKMGLMSILRALNLASAMSIQIIVVCACAGVIVGVISLTGVGARFSSLLLGVAETSQLLALIFAMCISILLGMGMPTTAAYAVAASVVAPGLVQLGIEPLTAHFFVFYFAVVSAITPPVALASYAAAGISGANAMETSVASFRIGLAAFIVPFMFFYNSALLMDASVMEIARALITATFGVYLLSGSVQAWIFDQPAGAVTRLLVLTAALLMIEGGLLTDVVGIAAAVVAYLLQKQRGKREPLQVKLLRVLEELKVERLGSNTPIDVDVRVIAATKANLKELSDKGEFRADLYYRLNVVQLDIPPLRKRKEDIAMLFHHFVLIAAARYQRESIPLTASQAARLVQHSWPGNVRELRNQAERYVLLGPMALADDQNAESSDISGRQTLTEMMDAFERSAVVAALNVCQGSIKDTMIQLGLARKTLYDKMKKHGLDKSEFKE